MCVFLMNRLSKCINAALIEILMNCAYAHSLTLKKRARVSVCRFEKMIRGRDGYGINVN